MKTVVNNKEIAHLWAHQTQSHARSGSMSFDGVRLNSYATEIARIIEHKGRKAYLLNETSYSNSTGRHQSYVRRSIPGDATIFHIGDMGRGCSLDVKPSVLFDYAIAQAAEYQAKAKRAKSNREWLAEREQSWLKEAASVSGFFGLRCKVDERAIERLAQRADKERARQAKAEREREKQRIAENQERIAQWLSGASVQIPYSIDRVYLRTMQTTNGGQPDGFRVMQTSKGATVPLADAERAFRFAVAARARGWHKNGEQFKIGDYELSAVNDQGVVAGCHRVAWDEIERYAKQEGWI